MLGTAAMLGTNVEAGDGRLAPRGALHPTGPRVVVAREIVAPVRAQRGAGLEISYGFCVSPLGSVLLMGTGEHLEYNELCGLAFAGGGGEERCARVLLDMTSRWPKARFRERAGGMAALVRRIFDPHAWQSGAPIALALIGTAFDIRVWSALLAIPMGFVTTYSAIAGRIGAAGAAHAVGAAVGRNSIGFLVPCHRVVGKDGGLKGYHWGLACKRALLDWEVEVVGARAPASSGRVVEDLPE